MIIVDSSALVAIFRREADAAVYASCIARDVDPRISAANLLECSMVLRGLRQMSRDQTEAWLDDFVKTAGIAIEPVTAEQIGLARSAHRRFGKGSGRRAGLNFGDCFAYALAKNLNAPLLFKGADFSLTDVTPAV